MEPLLPLVLSTAILALLLGGLATLLGRSGRVPRLSEQALPAADLPTLTVIAPALNEARHVEAAARALLRQDYPGLEVVFVDDRSTDATPAILARLAVEQPALRVVTVRELPAGWLGKNHANWVGSREARGELLLFTDADVVLAPGALRRAVGYLLQRERDHLAIAPQVSMPGTLLPQFTLYFGLLFSAYARPWAARDPGSRAHVGIGAFNLVRRKVYDAVGGHAALRMRPDDDMRLGLLLKRSGARQDFLNGIGAVQVEWYASWRELRDGLMKNLFAGLDYRVAATVGASLAQLALFAGAPVMLLGGWGGAIATALNTGSCLLLLALGAGCARQFGTRPWAGALLPALALFGAWLMWRSMLLTLWRGGIEWRGTFYPLRELRRTIV